VAAWRGVKQFPGSDLFASASLALNQNGRPARTEPFELASYLQNALRTAEKCHN
jgi:hypothetical protein